MNPSHNFCNNQEKLIRIEIINVSFRYSGMPGELYDHPTRFRRSVAGYCGSQGETGAGTEEERTYLGEFIHSETTEGN
jgi:hypothetical protein